MGLEIWLNEQSGEIEEFPIAPAALASIQTLVDEDKISISTATQNYSPRCWKTQLLMLQLFASKTAGSNKAIATSLAWVDQALAAYQKRLRNTVRVERTHWAIYGRGDEVQSRQCRSKKASALLREKLWDSTKFTNITTALVACSRKLQRLFLRLEETGSYAVQYREADGTFTVMDSLEILGGDIFEVSFDTLQM